MTVIVTVLNGRHTTMRDKSDKLTLNLNIVSRREPQSYPLSTQLHGAQDEGRHHDTLIKDHQGTGHGKAPLVNWHSSGRAATPQRPRNNARDWPRVRPQTRAMERR